ncbi:MAG: hypothetical protein ACYS8L_09500 [Planctomycetota bacterium]
MTGEERDLEDRLTRLLRSAVGQEARPSAGARERVICRLKAQLRATRAPVAFPSGILAVLVAVLSLIGAWLAVHTAGASQPPSASLPSIVAALMLGANFVSAPLASIVIVRRRTHA